MGSAIEIPQSVSNSTIHRNKQVLFVNTNLIQTKYNPNVLEPEYTKVFQCKKIIDKYTHVKSIKCIVSE